MTTLPTVVRVLPGMVRRAVRTAVRRLRALRPVTAPEVLAADLSVAAPAATDRGPRSALPRLLPNAVAALMAGASAAGLLRPGLYRDPEAMAAMFRAWDLVTLAVATPLLVAAQARARHGSSRARLLAAGMLGYAFYQYAYYVFGAALNPLLLLHVLVFLAAGVGLVLTLRDVDARQVSAAFGPRSLERAVAVLLAVLAAGLGGMWVFYSLRYAVTGVPLPQGVLVQPPSVLRLGYVMDLVTLVPAYLAAAVLLWRRAAWGVPLATVVLTASAAVQAAYMVALPFQVAAGVPGARALDPQEPLIAALITAAAAVLLEGLPGRAGRAPQAESAGTLRAQPPLRR